MTQKARVLSKDDARRWLRVPDGWTLKWLEKGDRLVGCDCWESFDPDKPESWHGFAVAHVTSPDGRTALEFRFESRLPSWKDEHPNNKGVVGWRIQVTHGHEQCPGDEPITHCVEVYRGRTYWEGDESKKVWTAKSAVKSLLAAGCWTNVVCGVPEPLSRLTVQFSGTTRFACHQDGADHWYSFDRRGVGDSFYGNDHEVKDPCELILAEAKRAQRSREQLERSQNIPGTPWQVTPERLEQVRNDLRQGRPATFTPAGFGVGNRFMIKQTRFARRANQETEQFIGLGPLWVEDMDCD